MSIPTLCSGLGRILTDRRQRTKLLTCIQYKCGRSYHCRECEPAGCERNPQEVSECQENVGMTRNRPAIDCPHCQSTLFHADTWTTDVYECPTCGRINEVTPTSHGVKRWSERAEDRSVAIKQAWDDGIRMYRHSFENPPATEVRYHHPSRIALLMRETDIISAIHIPTAREQARKSAVAAMIREDRDCSEIAALCAECEFDESALRSIMDEWRRDGADDGTASNAVSTSPEPQRSGCQSDAV